MWEVIHLTREGDAERVTASPLCRTHRTTTLLIRADKLGRDVTLGGILDKLRGLRRVYMTPFRTDTHVLSTRPKTSNSPRNPSDDGRRSTADAEPATLELERARRHRRRLSRTIRGTNSQSTMRSGSAVPRASDYVLFYLVGVGRRSAEGFARTSAEAWGMRVRERREGSFRGKNAQVFEVSIWIKKRYQ